MDVTDFSNNFLNNVLKKINQEQKKCFLGDFNVDLMLYNEHNPTKEFLDSLASDSYLPYIIRPSHSRTLIDNVSSNVISKDIIFGNITAIISDYLLQFLISPNTFANSSYDRSNVLMKEIGQNLARKILPWITLI